MRDIITITPIVAPVDEDHEETFGTPVTQRARVTQIDGQRYMKSEELADKVIYKVETWANDFGNNFKLTYNSVTYYPVKPPTVGRDKGSMRDMMTVIVATRV